MLRRLIKSLFILLLIFGCGLFEEEGICLIRNMETNSHHCYPDWTENVCIEKAAGDDQLHFYDWSDNKTCEEYCEKKDDCTEY